MSKSKSSVSGRKFNSKQLVTLALLSALIIVMSFTPLGYLAVNALNISLLTIPVAIGAIASGPIGGAILGAVFGLTSFSRCFGLTPLGTALCEISPIKAFILAVLPRVLDGFLLGVISSTLSKLGVQKNIVFTITGLLAAALNTLFYMSALVLLYGNSDIIQEYWQTLSPGKNVVAFVIAFVGINAVFEMIAATLITSAIVAALDAAKLIDMPKSKKATT